MQTTFDTDALPPSPSYVASSRAAQDIMWSSLQTHVLQRLSGILGCLLQIRHDLGCTAS